MADIRNPELEEKLKELERELEASIFPAPALDEQP